MRKLFYAKEPEELVAGPTFCRYLFVGGAVMVLASGLCFGVVVSAMDDLGIIHRSIHGWPMLVGAGLALVASVSLFGWLFVKLPTILEEDEGESPVA